MLPLLPHPTYACHLHQQRNTRLHIVEAWKPYGGLGGAKEEFELLFEGRAALIRCTGSNTHLCCTHTQPYQ